MAKGNPHAIRAAVSRREQSKAQNHARIFAAAEELFSTRGYEKVTTGQVAEHADVAAGTVFRYARTKAELLLMVANKRFSEQVRTGAWGARQHDDVIGAMRALYEPILAGVAVHGESTAAYQREMIFGDVDENYRSEALWILARQAAEISLILGRCIPIAGSSESRRLATRAIVAVIFIEIANGTRKTALALSTFERCEAQIRLIVNGLSQRT